MGTRQRRGARTSATAAIALLALVLAGCSAGGATKTGAEDVADAFLRAVARHDGSAACDLLTRDARNAVATTTRRSCASGVTRLDLPPTDADARAQVFGRAAVIEAHGDTVFLARSGSAWLVRAAGCTPRTDAPFDCTIDGS
jgi:hypothetical protein